MVLHAGTRSIPFKVELARSEQEHAIGLMNRPSMPTDRGMLFIFEKPARQRFWMKNTLIPLDMLFIGEDRKVVGIVSGAEPLSLDDRSVEGKSKYVLEINGGLCDRLGIAAGSPVDFVAIPEP